MTGTSTIWLISAVFVVWRGANGQLPFWDVNTYVDDVLNAGMRHQNFLVRFDPLHVPPFALHNSHDKDYGPVRFETSNVTGLSSLLRVQRGDQCASVTEEFPDRINVSCHVNFKTIKVYLNSLLTRDGHDVIQVRANVTFRDVLAHLDIRFLPWHNPVANLTLGATFSDLRSSFEGLSETAQTQRLIWGYEKAAKDLVASAITVDVSDALSRAAATRVFPCCHNRM